MSLDIERAGEPVETVEPLLALLRAGEKPAPEWRVGVEYEWLPYVADSLAPVSYERGIGALLTRLVEVGWAPSEPHAPLVALRRGAATITLEPGGQLELSGAPHRQLRGVAEEVRAHLDELSVASQPLGIRFAAFGVRPVERVDQMPVMPKPRYQAMRRYLPSHGRRALDMMFLTASVQASFDYASEADMVDKMALATRVSPLVAALCANSPYYDSRWHGYRSHRYAIWREVDPDRCGLKAFVLEPDFGYRRYADFILDTPMMFVRRRGEYLDAGGMTLRRFIAEGFGGERATSADLHNALAGVFPEVRLKNVIEVRSADIGSPAMCLAVVALWKGLLYDNDARARAHDLLRRIAAPDLLAMQMAAAQDGLSAEASTWHVGELCRHLLRLAKSGLDNAARAGLGHARDADLLAPLEEIAAAGRTQADLLIQRFGAGPLDASQVRQLMDASWVV